MPKVWKYHLSNLVRQGHLLTILPRRYDKFKAPESVVWKAEATTYRWPVRVTQEAKFGWKKDVVHLFRGIAKVPQRERRMLFLRWEVKFPVQSNPGLFILGPSTFQLAA